MFLIFVKCLLWYTSVLFLFTLCHTVIHVISMFKDMHTKWLTCVDRARVYKICQYCFNCDSTKNVFTRNWKVTLSVLDRICEQPNLKRRKAMLLSGTISIKKQTRCWKEVAVIFSSSVSLTGIILHSVFCLYFVSLYAAAYRKGNDFTLQN